MKFNVIRRPSKPWHPAREYIPALEEKQKVNPAYHTRLSIQNCECLSGKKGVMECQGGAPGVQTMAAKSHAETLSLMSEDFKHLSL